MTAANDDGLVTVDAAAYQRLQVHAAAGVLDAARQVVAAAVADGRIVPERAPYWTLEVVKGGDAAIARLSALTPVTVDAAADVSVDVSGWTL